MKRSSNFFLLISVVLIGCAPDAERSGSGQNDAENSVHSTQQAQDSIQNPKDEAVPKTDPQRQVIFGDQFPEVLAVKASGGEGGNWRFSVTLSSTYDSPQRYADAWRVLDDQGNQLGIRVLGHDHANEQPFTRSGTIQIPAGTSTVFVEGRDKANGWSGQRFEFEMP